jgi:hypothetical protein
MTCGTSLVLSAQEIEEKKFKNHFLFVRYLGLNISFLESKKILNNVKDAFGTWYYFTKI